MRLIDADALTGRMKAFLCNPKRCDDYGGVRCRACNFDDAFNWIDAEPTADAAPLKPLAKWLAGYAMPPAQPTDMSLEARAAAWDVFLRCMDWEAVE